MIIRPYEVPSFVGDVLWGECPSPLRRNGLQKLDVYLARPERAIHHQPRAKPWGTMHPKIPRPANLLPPCWGQGGRRFAGRGGSCRVAFPGCRSAREASLCPGLMMNCPFGAHLVHRKLTITKHSSPPHSQNAVFFLCDNPPLLDLFQPAIQERWFVPPYRQGAVHLKT